MVVFGFNLKNLKPFKESSDQFKKRYNMLEQRSTLLHYLISGSSQYWVLEANTDSSQGYSLILQQFAAQSS